MKTCTCMILSSGPLTSGMDVVIRITGYIILLIFRQLICAIKFLGLFFNRVSGKHRYCNFAVCCYFTRTGRTTSWGENSRRLTKVGMCFIFPPWFTSTFIYSIIWCIPICFLCSTLQINQKVLVGMIGNI